ncbi:MAG: Na+/H+ antiporter NhaC family protein [Cytophagales bacterium]|nr:Na+/H+ antiporter NhaC family protein [Cytophagales bacterium]
MGIAPVIIDGSKKITVKDTDSGIAKFFKIRHIPAWLSILPPLIAIAMALIFREVLVSLFLGIFSGALILLGFHPKNWIPAMYNVLDNYIINAMMDTGHLSVILFSTLIGGMVAIISKNGGMAGVVDKLSKYAKSARSAQFITWFLGIAIFFDDYANTLIVGNTMRPVTDKFKISREKLAYIVDSTAAPVAAIAFITTWIGAELGYIQDASVNLRINENAYSMFLNSLQYAFYPIFTLVFMFFLIYFKKDFGSMYKAEIRSRVLGTKLKIRNSKFETRNSKFETRNSKLETRNSKFENNESLKDLDPVEGVKQKWYNAFIPVISVVLVTIAALLVTGAHKSFDNLLEAGIVIQDYSFMNVWENLYHLNNGQDVAFFRKLGIIIGNADAYVALLWASLSGVVLAILLTVIQRIMPLRKIMDTLVFGFKTMLPAVLILILAWSLAKITGDLHTADFLTSLFSGAISPVWMPTVVFILAALISFSTGSSWGTMAILYPLMLPATWLLCQQSGFETGQSMPIFYNVISVVLAGSVFGDHCSPISDTTILSSLATNCNHVDHVRTQLPYAITVAVVSLLVCAVFVNMGIPWYFNYLLGFVMLFLIVKYLGRSL